MIRCIAPLLLSLATPAVAQSGTLVIVGGALQDDNKAVYEAMIAAMPANAPDIAVIPAASGYPGGSAQRMADALARYGVSKARVRLVELAVVDDPETPGIDESTWANGASDQAQIARLQRAGLIWFTGGDQARIIAALAAKDGSDTPMLAAIRARLAAGAVIGGSSAGAAIMGEHMIGCGSAATALVARVSRDAADCAASEETAGDDEPLVLTKGLGFLPDAVVDQHFSERGRLGRLVRAVACVEGDIVGMGIDEDTAMVIDLADPVGTVVGKGTVTTLHTRDARACVGAVLGPTLMIRRSATSKP